MNDMHKPALPISAPSARRAAFCAIVLLLAIAGCHSKPQTVVSMKIGNATFELEVANTENVRMKGLMNRQSMPADHGMIFVFHDETERNFWMKDTLIPLDIIYISGDGRVVSIRQMHPLDEKTQTRSVLPAKWAIELNQGAAAKCGVSVGDQLTIPADAQDTPS